MTREERVALERVRVLVEDRRPEEDHQVAGDVNDEIEEEADAGEADEDLRADRRGEDALYRGRHPDEFTVAS